MSNKDPYIESGDPERPKSEGFSQAAIIQELSDAAPVSSPDKASGEEAFLTVGPEVDKTAMETRFPDHFITFKTFNESDDLRHASEEARIMYLRNAAGLFAELRDKYQVPMKRVDYAVKPEGERPGYFTIREKIEGITLSAALGDPESPLRTTLEGADMVDDLYAKMAKYYHDKLTTRGESASFTGEAFITDCHPLQYMLGHTVDDPVDRIYYADQDPHHSRQINEDGPGGIFASLQKQALAMALNLQIDEGRLKKPPVRAFESVLLLLHALPSNPPHPSTTQAIDDMERRLRLIDNS